MKTKRTAFLILLACLLLFSALTLPLALTKTQEDESAVFAETFVTDIPVSEIGAVMIENGSGRFGLLAEAEEIEMIAEDLTDGQDATAAFSQTEMRSLMYAASHLTALRRLTEHAPLSDYGYDTPLANVTLLKKDRTNLTFRILSMADTGQGYYCYAEADDALYLIDPMDAELFLRSRDDFVTHTLFPKVEAADCAREVLKVSVAGTDGAYELKSLDGRFYLTAPFSQKLRTSVVYGDLIAALTSLYAERTVSTEGGFAAMGITDADLTVEMETASGTYGARFFFEGDRCLAEVPDTGFVYSFSAEEVRLLPRDALTLLQNRAFYYALGDLRELQLTSVAGEILFVMTGSGEEMQVHAGEKELSRDDIITLSEALNSLPVAAVREQPKDLPQGEQVLSLQLLMTDGTRETLTVVRLTDGATDAVVNGDTCNFTVRSSDTDALVSALISLAAP